jgi:PAS domain S-box-containing protein
MGWKMSEQPLTTGDLKPALTIDLRTERDIVSVRQRAREFATLLGFDQHEQTRISTAASEIARNAFKYASGGKVEFSFDTPNGGRPGLRIKISDHGPGIPHLASVLEGCFQSKTGMGKGILGAKRLMDVCDIQTEPGKGTAVTLEKFLPQGVNVTPSTVARLTEEVVRSAPRDPFLEVQHQNQELMRALQEVQSREAELARLHAILQRESDEAIRLREARLQGIIGSAMDAIISLDEQRRIVVFNAAAEKMFLCAASEAVGSSFDRFTSESFRSSYRETIRKFELSGTAACSMSADGLTARRTNGEEFPVEAAISHVNVAGQELFTVILRDITERKRAEMLEQQLRQSQKMEALGRLAGGVAHDFNNLLSVIVGYSYVIQSSSAAGDAVRNAADQVMGAAERASALTRQLLAFSRKQVIQPQVVDLNGILGGMEKMLSRMIGEDIDLRVVHGADLKNVKADPGHIEQVVMNLVVNARDAMPEGGNLLIETKNVVFDEAEARHHGFNPGSYVLLALTDTGEGMDAETQSKIFEPFFTTKEPGKGTGLGLATVYAIVQQSGGHIWVYSEKGHGTTMKIYLPVTGETPAEPCLLHAPKASMAGTETILLVEDEAGLRELLASVFQDKGYKVLVAANGVEAVRIVEEHQGPIAALITDVIMPKMRGQQLASWLSERHPETIVIYMSGYTDNALVHAGVLDSPAMLLQKPFTPDFVLCKLREALDASMVPRGNNR